MELRDFSKTYFDLEQNNKFVLLKEDPKFKMAIQNFEIPFMNRIGIEKNKQFGIEIEFKYAELEKLQSRINCWKEKTTPVPTMDQIVEKEDWITEENQHRLCGGEVDSPILYDKKEDWRELQTVCEMIKDLGGIISWQCGLHIHIDFEKLNLTKEQVWNLIMIWYRYEDILYGFAKGEVNKVRDGVVFHSQSIRPFLNKLYFSNNLNRIYKPVKTAHYFTRYYGLNLKEYQKGLLEKEMERPTIEFRIGNTTLSPNIVQNYVRLYSHILTKAQSPNLKLKFDKVLPSSKVSSLYKENIDIDKACEFADFIFDDNLDKFCFMKQYVKVK